MAVWCLTRSQLRAQSPWAASSEPISMSSIFASVRHDAHMCCDHHAIFDIWLYDTSGEGTAVVGHCAQRAHVDGDSKVYESSCLGMQKEQRYRHMHTTHRQIYAMHAACNSMSTLKCITGSRVCKCTCPACRIYAMITAVNDDSPCS